MYVSRSTSRPPRGGVDPIRTEADALAVLALAAPYGHDTVGVVLDDERRGHTIHVVTGTTDPDAVFRVIDLCLGATLPDAYGLLLASARPGGGVVPADRLRWVEAAMQCDDAGVELVEWFVFGSGIGYPRELAGDPPRWNPW
ncbi:MAG TPA: hypothetical protein VK860_02315 [Ilumatobacteraceae bacterium]|nr:hypothetical protein [Ilumatobacteraceae bacterium]